MGALCFDNRSAEVWVGNAELSVELARNPSFSYVVMVLSSIPVLTGGNTALQHRTIRQGTRRRVQGSLSLRFGQRSVRNGQLLGLTSFREVPDDLKARLRRWIAEVEDGHQPEIQDAKPRFPRQYRLTASDLSMRLIGKKMSIRLNDGRTPLRRLENETLKGRGGGD